ncbi:MAG TPA: hypothetical protein VGJ22_15030 [Anaerolineales bacterium]
MKTPNRTNAEELIPTRQSLLSRLKDWNDDESWQDFFLHLLEIHLQRGHPFRPD